MTADRFVELVRAELPDTVQLVPVEGTYAQVCPYSDEWFVTLRNPATDSAGRVYARPFHSEHLVQVMARGVIRELK